MNLIWATRGRTWGFRFLRDGGFDDPLRAYEDAFTGLEDRTEVYRRAAGSVALRFPDPEGRQDASGRVIPHDFVLLEAGTETGPDSLEDGIQLIWPLVAEGFAELWDQPEPLPPLP